MIDINKILDDLKHYKGFRNDIDLASFLSITPSALSSWRKKNTLNFSRVAQKFPEVDANYLATGKGSMLKSENFQNVVQTTTQGENINQQNTVDSGENVNITRITNEQIEKVADNSQLLEQIEIQNKTIETLQSQKKDLLEIESKLLKLLSNLRKE